MQELQTHWRYLPWEALRYICEHTDITPTQISGVATFYAQFRLTPVGKHIIKVCHGTACHVGGAEGLSESLEKHLCCKSGATTEDQMFTLEKVACVGCCSLAPCIMIGNKTFGRLDRKKVVRVINDFRAAYEQADESTHLDGQHQAPQSHIGLAHTVVEQPSPLDLAQAI